MGGLSLILLLGVTIWALTVDGTDIAGFGGPDRGSAIDTGPRAVLPQEGAADGTTGAAPSNLPTVQLHGDTAEWGN
jgi:hypothetical protein